MTEITLIVIRHKASRRFFFLFIYSFVLCVCSLLLVGVNYSLAQQNIVDSLKTLLKTTTHDTTRANILITITENLGESSTDSVISLCKQVINITEKNLNKSTTQEKQSYLISQSAAYNNIGYVYYNQGKVNKSLAYLKKSLTIEKKIGNNMGVAGSLNNIAYIYQNNGQIKEALDYYNRSLIIRDKIGDSAGIAESYNNLATLYKSQGKIKEALDYLGRSLRIRERIVDKKGIASTLSNMGNLYEDLGQVKEALEYYTNCLKIDEETNNKQGIANSLNNLASCFIQQANSLKNPISRPPFYRKFTSETLSDKFDSLTNLALILFNRSLMIHEEIDNKSGIARTLNSIGRIYQKQGKFDFALENYFKSLNIFRQIKDKQWITFSLNDIGESYFLKNKFQKSRLYADSSFSLANELGYPELLCNSELLFAKIDSAGQNFYGSFEHYKKYIIYRDSLKNKENEKLAIRQQTKYEFEKALLVKEQAETEKKRQLTIAVSRRDRLQYSVILIVVLTLMSFVMLLGKFKVNVRMSEGIIFFTFLILFEFLLVLADPYLENFTEGAPGYKLLFNALIALGIYPVHSFFEGLLKKRLKKGKKKTDD